MNAVVPGIHFAPSLDDADALLARLESEIDVSAELIALDGTEVRTPRLTGWYGEPGAVYTYSGITRLPKPWTPTLALLRDRLNSTLGIALNSCLVGVYEDGAHCVDWHADHEAELRDRIVSVSLGAARTFLLRDRAADIEHALELGHGSVLVMTVESQQLWQHAVPPDCATGRRINLTFRVIAHD